MAPSGTATRISRRLRSKRAGSHSAMSFAPIDTVTRSGERPRSRGSWSRTASSVVAPETLRFTVRTERPVRSPMTAARTPT